MNNYVTLTVLLSAFLICAAASTVKAQSFTDDFDGASLDPAWEVSFGRAGQGINVGGGAATLLDADLPVTDMDPDELITMNRPLGDISSAEFIRLEAHFSNLALPNAWDQSEVFIFFGIDSGESDSNACFVRHIPHNRKTVPVWLTWITEIGGMGAPQTFKGNDYDTSPYPTEFSIRIDIDPPTTAGAGGTMDVSIFTSENSGEAEPTTQMSLDTSEYDLFFGENSFLNLSWSAWSNSPGSVGDASLDLTKVVFWDGTTATPPPPIPAGGGSFILADDFDTGQPVDYWEGSCGACGTCCTDVGYVRGGASPGMDGDGEWEHWHKSASGAGIRSDGDSSIGMEMGTPPWQTYIDNRVNGMSIVAGASYAVICSLTMPADGSGGMFFGFSNPPGSFNKGIKCVGGSIYWAQDDDSSGDIWTGATANDVDTGATYTGGEQFTVLFHISTAGDLEIWWHAGAMKATNGPDWVDITPSGVSYDYASNLPADDIPSPPFKKNIEVMSLHTVGTGTVLETDLCVVDYLAWIENPNMIPVELSSFMLD